MSRIRKFFMAVAAIVVLIIGGSYWLTGTESGTRWILGRAAAVLPEELVIGEARGSFLRGLHIETLEWFGEPVRISIRDIYIDIQLMPLFVRHVAVNELTVARFDLRTTDTEPADGEPGLPTIVLPVGISIEDAALQDVFLKFGSFEQAVDKITLAGNMSGSDLDITRLAYESPRLAFDLDGRVKLDDNWPGRAHVAWRWNQSETLGFAGELRLQGDVRRYDLRHSLTAPELLSTTGSVSFESGVLLADITNEWESLELSIGERRLQSPTGSLRLQGSVDDYAVDLEARARLDELPETQIELTGDAGLQAIRIARLRAVNEFGELTGTGDASWLPEPTFGIDFSLSGLNPALATDAVSGALAFDGYVSGTSGERSPEIELRIDRIAGNINGHSLEGGANVVYAANVVSVSDGRVQAGSNRVVINGSIGESVSIDADIEFAAITELLPDASGALRARLNLSGPRMQPDARIELTGSELQYAEYAIAGFSAEAGLSPTGRSFATLQMERISAGAISLDSAGVSANGRIDEHGIRVSLQGYDSDVQVGAGGSFSNDRWSARIDSFSITNDALGRWTNRQPSEVSASSDEVALSETCVFAPSTTGRACLAGNFRRDGSASVDFSMGEVPLSALPSALPGGVNLSGLMDAHLQVDRLEAKLTGNAAIELRQPTIDANYDGEAVSVSFSDAGVQATISENRIESVLRLETVNGAASGNLEFSVQDFTDRKSAIAGRGRISISDASVFGVLLPDVANPRGKIDGGLAISGNLNAPEFTGEIALTDGSVVVRRAGIEIVDIEARLSQHAAGLFRLSGSARSGSGQVSIRGETLLTRDTGIRTEIVLSGENFELARLPDWQVAASPSITLVFDERLTTVSGDLGIPSANITVKEIPESAASPSPDAIVHRAEGTQSYTGRRIAVDVTTTLGDDVQFSGFGLTADLSGTVRLQGGTNEPYVGNGILVLRNGRFRAYGQELEIERGELLFNGPLDNPQLNVRATRRANDVIAGIQLSGTPSQLRSEVFSEPALSDAEALSYLLTGRPLASASGAAEGNVLNNAAFALGLTGAGRIASQVRNELGLETLTVEGGSDSGRIVAGKRFGSNLLVEYGYGFIDKLGTLLLRYRLSDRFVLESRTGTVSELDLVYTVEKQ